MIKSISLLFSISIFTCMVYSQANQVKYIAQKQPRGYVYIPSGTYCHPADTTSIWACQKSQNQITVAAFWMKETEVTNAEYQEYLDDLCKSLKINQYKNAYPDTAVIHRQLWISRYCDYFTHPYFKNYPVVGVSAYQAEMYCIWLSGKLQKAYPDQQYGFFRLPLREEWEYAARGGRGQQPYPWGGPYCRNSKGCMLAQYQFKIETSTLPADFDFSSPWVFGKEHIPQLDKFFTQNDTLRKKRSFIYPAGIPAPVYSYFINDWGLYNVVGNVAELTRGNSDSLRYTAYGGSYAQPAAYMDLNTMIPNYIDLKSSAADVGFRPVMSYVSRKKTSNP